MAEVLVPSHDEEVVATLSHGSVEAAKVMDMGRVPDIDQDAHGGKSTTRRPFGGRALRGVGRIGNERYLPPVADVKVLYVVGARPNFMKVAPILHASAGGADWENFLVHTGQHYDEVLSSQLFTELGIPDPDVNLGVGSGTHAVQTAAVLHGLDPILDEEAPDLVLVVGDVNSTVAAALCAAKRNIPVAHVEAGLRSGDRTMPEELNRLVTDQLATLCLTPSRDADENLMREGITPDRICFVGNVMIDTLFALRPRALELGVPESYGVAEREYVLLTLHRPSNVDDPGQLAEIVEAVEEIAADVPVICPLHPRTHTRLESFGLSFNNARALPPLGYLEMLSLMSSAGLVMTDSGGIQEETTALGVPCLTLRSSTERPITIHEGTNTLVPVRERAAILAAFRDSWHADVEPGAPEGWDGRAAERVVEEIDAWAGR
jgi:UDP-N-acetylglucosamine 2-epimerase (non-hydrolysing)